MRRVHLWAAVVLIASGAWTPAAAEVPSDEWDFVVAPYSMGAAMSGTTTVRGRELDIDLSASDILSNLEFGAMGYLVARKGNWGFGSDLIWMAYYATRILQQSGFKARNISGGMLSRAMLSAE